jgi:hypothetical protein
MGVVVLSITFIVFLHPKNTRSLINITTCSTTRSTTWVLHGFYMGSTWVLQALQVLHGYYMGTTWVLHGYYMGTTWVLHGYYMYYMHYMHYMHYMQYYVRHLIKPLWGSSRILLARIYIVFH